MSLRGLIAGAWMVVVLDLGCTASPGGASVPDIPTETDSSAPVDLGWSDADRESGTRDPGARDPGWADILENDPGSEDLSPGEADGASDPEETCTVFLADNDGDGYGQNTESRCLPAPDALYRALRGGDCDDGNPYVNPGAQEDCLTPEDDDCDGETNGLNALGCRDAFVDADGDGWHLPQERPQCWCTPPEGMGFTREGDCDDDDASIHPGAEDPCDGIDQDCNGIPDNALCPLRVFFCDQDGDGHWSRAVTGTCASWDCIPTDCRELPGDDCDDHEVDVHPDAEETCNGTDDDCDGSADGPEVCPVRSYYCDQDRDGHRSTHPSGSCAAWNCVPADCPEEPGDDCNDGDEGIFPGAPEVCNGRDDDCDGGADGRDVCPVVTYFCDQDGDGFPGRQAFGTCGSHDCVPTGCSTAPGLDCDDGDSQVHPGAEELCNGIDDDCNGLVDDPEACPRTPYWCDQDQDGHVSANPSGHCRGISCIPAGCQTSPGDDCDDRNEAIYSGAVEVCNGIDDDCDGNPEPPWLCPVRVFFCDRDGDGHLSLEPSGSCQAWACVPLECREEPGDDCNDLDGQVFPGAGEDCDTPWDDDCDGALDAPEARHCLPWFFDQDGDGWHAPDAESVCRCLPVFPFTAAEGGDCDDDHPEVHPEAPEVCNGRDDDCDGDIDAGGACIVLYYCDEDGDYYLSATPSGSCLEEGCIPEGCRDRPGRDCDDHNGAVYPGAVEDCETPWDDNCDGGVDVLNGQNCRIFHRDQDRDGHGHPTQSECRCLPRFPFTAPPEWADDCNDNDPAVFPGAEEACNGLDDDCDGMADGEGVCPMVAFWCDRDQDGHRAATPSGNCSSFQCVPSDCLPQPGGDCDDGAPAVHPGAPEVCNGLDDDCDGMADGEDICPTVAFWCDQDGDGHRAIRPTGSCDFWQCIPPGCTDQPGDDCADGNPAIYPDALESCNGLDDDCDGLLDPPGTCPSWTWYCDLDEDGHRSTVPSGTCNWFGCVPGPCDLSPGGDCNDGNPSIHPDAPEVCNGLDDDCDGVRDGPGVCPLWDYYCDQDQDGFHSLQPSGTCQWFDCIPVGCLPEPGDDCVDLQAGVHPGADDRCNGMDDDCNGATDDGNCIIDGRCVNDGEGRPGDPCRACVASMDPTGWTAMDGEPCDDQRTWTIQDTCQAGTCLGVLADCFSGIGFGDALRTESLLVGDDGNPGEGLDVDGNPSTCQPQGTYPDGRPQCSAGIDNTAALVDEVVNQELPGALTSGAVHLLMEFRGLDVGGTPEVFFYNGEKADPTCNHRQPGCSYRVPASAFDGNCRPLMGLAPVTWQGTFLRAGGPQSRIPLSMPLVGSTVLSVTLYHAAMEGQLSFDSQGRVIAFSGVLAGAMRKAELFAALEQVPDEQLPLPRDQILILLNLLLRPDIDTDGNGAADAISLGLKATADAAVISGVSIP